MASDENFESGRGTIIKHFLKYRKFWFSIYGRVIYMNTILAIILFMAFGIISRSVNKEYLNTVIRQCGNNIGSLVGGALHNSMLLNDKTALQNTLDVIHTMKGIDGVNLYNQENILAYSSHSFETEEHNLANCMSCHPDIKLIFPAKERSYKIIDKKTACSMAGTGEGHRQLYIRSPIFNDRSCYTSSCHAHSQSEEVLGSLLIKIPLRDIDEAMHKSSRDFYIAAAVITILLVSVLIMFTRRHIKKPLNSIIVASEA
ncbi:MAG: hypothetical protein K8R53_15235, partial [Bacteroidales bacterium]|nr:hypothetical protein [Bacteroidales bacterium]